MLIILIKKTYKNVNPRLFGNNMFLSSYVEILIHLLQLIYVVNISRDFYNLPLQKDICLELLIGQREYYF